MKSKKGLGIAQVFIFIVAALTFALIMIFGFKAITQFIDKGEDVSFVQFKTDLEKSIKQISTEFGSVRQETFTLTGDFEKICFVNLDASFDQGGEELCLEDAIACEVWRDAQAGDTKGYTQVDENVFLTPPALVKIKVHKLEFDANLGYLCVPIERGQFKLLLEGRGDRTLIAVQQ